jgi:hypothetical protein
MATNRTYYPTKAEWAAAKAADLRRTARQYPVVPSSDWQGVRRRMTAIRALNADADRYERLSLAFKARMPATSGREASRAATSRRRRSS